MSKTTLKIALCLFVLGLSSAIGPAVQTQTKPPASPDFATLAKQFDYDKTKPLDLEDRVIAQRRGYSIHEITYASPVSGRVPGFLLIPASAGPHPAVLFGHWGGGDHTEFLAKAGIYARAGDPAIANLTGLSKSEGLSPINRPGNQKCQRTRRFSSSANRG